MTAWADPAPYALETDALQVAAELGLGIPCYVTVDDPARPDVTALTGERVVVKALSAALAHKARRGAVRVVARDVGAIAAAMAEIRKRVPGVQRFLVAEYVPHGRDVGGELLLGVRWTDAFGPVVTLGLGGVDTEMLASVAGGPLFFGPETDVGAALSRWELGVGLSALVGRFADFAQAAMPERVAEFEVNPLVITDDGPMALDALLRPGPADAATPAPPRPLAKLARLLRPDTIAIVGVSSGMNPGRLMLRNVLRAGFPPQRVTVVKPGADTIDGCRCVPTLADLPRPADLLVLAVAAHQVPDLVEEVTAHGRAESVVVIPGGLGERTGSEPMADRIAKVVQEARPGGPVVNGGNCLGVRSVPGRYDTFFIPPHKIAPPAAEVAPVAVVAQSGAFVLARLDRLSWLRPRYVVSLGNQVDLTAGDYLSHFAADPEVEIVACYLEGLRPGDGRRLLAAARTMRARGGAVVLYMAGRTPAGIDSAASHTASLAPDHRVAAALAEQAGALVADTLDGFTDLMALAVQLRDRAVAGLRLGAVSNAGFECVVIADRLGPFSLASFAPGTTRRLAETLDAGGVGDVVAARNPLDLTPMLDDEAFAAAAAAVVADPGVDVALVGCVPFTGALETLAPAEGHGEDTLRDDAVAGRLARLFDRSDKAWGVVVDGGPRYDAMADALAGAGVPVFRSADRAMAALGRYCAWRVQTMRGGGATSRYR